MTITKKESNNPPENQQQKTPADEQLTPWQKANLE